jgi:hypothetical protein
MADIQSRLGGVFVKQLRQWLAFTSCVLLLYGVSCSRQEAPKSADEAATAAPAAAASGKLNACAMLSKATITEITGLTVEEVKDGTSSPFMSRCTYSAADATTVDVMIKRSAVKYDVASAMEGMKKTMPGIPQREVAGIGDKAYYIGGQLNVFRGGDYVLISMLGFPPGEKTDAAAAALARKVLSQI